MAKVMGYDSNDYVTFCDFIISDWRENFLAVLMKKFAMLKKPMWQETADGF